MIRRSCLAVIASLVSLALASCTQPTDNPSPLRVRADVTGPTLTFSASRPAFVAQFPALPMEDFEAGRVADGEVAICPGPLDATNDDRCFAPGEIKPGIRFNGVSSSEAGFELALVGAGFGGVEHSKQLVADFPSDTFVVEFTGTVTAAGMDLVSVSSDNTCQIDIFGVNNVLLGSTTAPCTPAGTFWGVVSSEPITRITIFSPPEDFEGVDNISFGVAHVPPVANAGGPYSGLEGSQVDFDGRGSFDPEGGSLTFRWEWGDGTAPGAGAQPSHTYADNGDYTVTLTVSNGTLTNSASTTATIANVAPSLEPISGLPVDPVALGTPVTASATFSDVGTADTHSGVIDWGDGTPSVGVVVEANGSGLVSSTHSYSAAGVYTVTLTLADKDGAAVERRCEFVVVFDPAAGYVTGSGWIDSPAGAYTPDPSLTGKAIFGFVSRFQKGATTPNGSAQFDLRIAGFSFRSTSYDGLSLSGSKAQCRGSGTVNGTGDFAFLLTAGDGDSKGKPDTFRIKITDRATGTVIYDNNMGRGEGAPATTELGAGSIVIHP